MRQTREPAIKRYRRGDQQIGHLSAIETASGDLFSMCNNLHNLSWQSLISSQASVCLLANVRGKRTRVCASEIYLGSLLFPLREILTCVRLFSGIVTSRKSSTSAHKLHFYRNSIESLVSLRFNFISPVSALIIILLFHDSYDSDSRNGNGFYRIGQKFLLIYFSFNETSKCEKKLILLILNLNLSSNVSLSLV